MSELTLTLLRLGFLALLWLLVVSVVAVLRRDLFGTQVRRKDTPARSRAARARVRTAVPAPAGIGGAEGGVGPTPSGPGTAARQLVVIEGSLKGTSLGLGQAPVLMGRAPECTLVLEDDYASNRHAQLFLRDGAWMLEDLGSTNGTYVGRRRLDAPIAVEAGTRFRIGRTTLELRR
jgi:hypothetical protein